jgi:ubiquinone/menaquinone biosynthesis C-methylase UbiE
LTDNYYTSKLSSNKLKQCYDIAPRRVIEYLEAEIEHVLKHIASTDDVLELGCGYGRVLERLVSSARIVVGIDTSKDSLRLVTNTFRKSPACELFQMNAQTIGFRDDSFDKTICIQNGISAFKVDPKELILETIRVTRNGGMCLFSSYSDKFWDHRLEWFKMQSERGLLGEIDWDNTRDGIIVCKDGFKATTFRDEDFSTLTSSLHLEAEIIEVNQSSMFCEIKVEK